MKLRLFFTPNGLTEDQILGRTTVVIDVLRATSVAAVALKNGAREIIPVATLGDASGMRAKLDPSMVVLGGERDGRKVEGFDLGNSPFEYGPERIEKKSIVLATTNGSAALLIGSEGDHCLACAIINTSEVARRLAEIKQDIAVICSGNKGGFSLEDTLCGGMLIDRLQSSSDNLSLENDAAWVALDIFNKHKHDLETALKQSDHGTTLVNLGFERDVNYCSQADKIEICPVWKSGRLIRLDSE
jgi:2-phosphosulfolactate phosphatase